MNSNTRLQMILADTRIDTVLKILPMRWQPIFKLDGKLCWVITIIKLNQVECLLPNVAIASNVSPPLKAPMAASTLG
ncbi:MAG: hypothetical protein V7L29_17080 [Nostoc sp.]|uniref:hypothetical protein n=1 Tax=Nostoc sp. TaxID=1180 RepID=UPI002FEF76F6